MEKGFKIILTNKNNVDETMFVLLTKAPAELENFSTEFIIGYMVGIGAIESELVDKIKSISFNSIDKIQINPMEPAKVVFAYFEIYDEYDVFVEMETGKIIIDDFEIKKLLTDPEVRNLLRLEYENKPLNYIKASLDVIFSEKDNCLYAKETFI